MDSSDEFGSNVTAKFGLTPAELRLTLAVAAGDDLLSISQKHQVSVHTIRNQLKSIFLKTGVNRQIELAVLVHELRLPK